MPRRRLAASLVLAAVALLAVPALALAHAEFVSSTPAPGATVEGPPAEVVIEFSQDLDPSRTSIEVRDASGTTVASGGELGAGPREFRLALPELAPGAYEVRWTSFSAEDSELARDTFTFTVAAAPSPSPSAAASAQTSPSAEASPSPSPEPSAAASPSQGPSGGGTGSGDTGLDIATLLPIAAALVVVVALGAWFVRTRRG